MKEFVESDEENNRDEAMKNIQSLKELLEGCLHKYVEETERIA